MRKQAKRENFLPVFLLCGEWAGSLKSAYPFIKHFSISIVMIIIHLSGYTIICGNQKKQNYTFFDTTVFGFLISRKERQTAGYNNRAAPDWAITGNRDNDTPV